MRVLITGANGFIGSHLATALADKGHEVLACVRNPVQAQQRRSHITAIKADFVTDCTESDWIPRLQDVDVVINAVGIIRENRLQTFDTVHTRTPLALFSACESAGVKRVIQISALGADENAVSRYHKSKYSADSYLRNCSLDWAIIMPSVVYGAGAVSMALFKAVSALPLVPLIDKGAQEIQPIHIGDMTTAIVQLVETPSTLKADIEMVGPEPVTMKALYKKLRYWLGLGKAKYFSVPYRLALHGARLAGILGRGPITAEAVQMLHNGNTAAVGPFLSRFGFKPNSIDTMLANIPAQQSDRWHAGLYFLAPVLRVTIAFVWIFTGIVSAFVFPVEQSYAMLARAGIADTWQPLMLYAAATTDILLGIATLVCFKLRLVVFLQICVILLYSVVVSLWLPEHWIHPFGAMTKNLPLVVATLVMLVTEERT